MRAPKFKEFISEAKGNEKFRLLIVTDEPDQAKQFHTANRLKDECDKLNISSYLFQLSAGYTQFVEGIRTFHNKDDKKGFVIDKNTVAIIRGSVTRKDSWLDFISILEKANVCLVNSRQTISICVDKYRSALKLADYGLTQPKSVLINNPKTILEQVEEAEIKFPLIMKTLRGSKGVGVLFIDSERGLDSIVQLINKQDEDADLLVQEYIKTDYDVRVLVLGDKILATMKRPVIEGDFRSNVSQGSKPEKIKLTELEIEESLKAAKAVNGLWTAVDFIPSKNREKEPPFMLEVNSSPGTEGMEEATGMNIAKDVIKFFQDKINRYKVPTECGHREVVSIQPWGDMVAKFDTGNSVLSVIHGEDIKVKGDKVSFTLLGKRHTYALEKTYKVKIGSIRNYTEERPVIRLDVGFAGDLYKDEPFGIDDRTEMGTEVLLTRRIMTEMNIMVNPARKYVVTTKYSLD
jgi:ribosomal protein S6--L-glutamate ligase